ncbi:hypothetical protein BGZ65_001606 [Modicella reniformis]|uniref:Uncharacterized protein n=1 Tax=Modicella reniformis TaxID=1440133 RepID=A0A9P6ILI5_9FUNG|nr:hypothetical protein BGZ65_001606 [Modicella reniformis]
MAPVEQCLAKLLGQYPDIVAYVFRATSYIPAHNHAYVASHAIKIGNRFQDYIDGNQNPVYTLRSQLPTRDPSKYFILGERPETKFPSKPDKQLIDKKRTRVFYVSPFQFRRIVKLRPEVQPVNEYTGAKKDRILQKQTPQNEKYESVFDRITGKDFFSNPVIVASLRFKWYKFVLKYRLSRLFFVFILFLLVVVITSKQISVSAVKKGQTLTEDEIAARYLPGWRPVFMTTIALGCLLSVYEFWQIKYSPKKYIKSPYNYIDLAAFISPVVGCFYFLNAVPGTIQEGTGIDGGPSQAWIMAFSIIFLYLNMVELRIIRQLGVAVNIIFNIAKRIIWFMLMFTLFLVGFTHALLYRKCPDGWCEDVDFPAGYPTGFFAALTTTFFFLPTFYAHHQKDYYKLKHD